VTYLQLHRPVPAPVPAPAPAAPPTLDFEAHCARIARAYDLTRREEDVLRLLMEGCTFAQAADSLVVSLNTVKSHVRHLYAKMGVTGKQDLLDKVSSDS
jgi:DNA-binding CsgD family transcriptional regulator